MGDVLYVYLFINITRSSVTYTVGVTYTGSYYLELLSYFEERLYINIIIIITISHMQRPLLTFKYCLSICLRVIVVLTFID